MKILLIGEYSRLHNSLKEGLLFLNHEVFIVGNGDGFKSYPVDFSIEAKFSTNYYINILRQLIFKILKYDFAQLERGIRFYFLLPKFKRFDIIQLINEAPIQTHKRFELYLLKKIHRQNNDFFLLSCGIDYLNTKFWFENKTLKSSLFPFFKNQNLKSKFQFVFEYLSTNHIKIHNFVYEKCNGIIASDFDYVPALKNNGKYLGLIPNPINCTKLNYIEHDYTKRIVIFLGINEWNYHQKGIVFFEKALDIIQEKYKQKVEIIISKNIPYHDYINLYNKAHILLDQCFANDQGYNALEAMAKGKVVFTGAEKDFQEYYNITDSVCINAKPDVDYLVQELSFLIENHEEIIAIGKRARAFVEKEHNYVKIAEKYLQVWNNN